MDAEVRPTDVVNNGDAHLGQVGVAEHALGTSQVRLELRRLVGGIHRLDGLAEGKPYL